MGWPDIHCLSKGVGRAGGSHFEIGMSFRFAVARAFDGSPWVALPPHRGLILSINAIVGRFLFGLLASALRASIGSKECPFGLVGYLV
jgi:hypothetical protein